jgi:hypothetical protein
MGIDARFLAYTGIITSRFAVHAIRTQAYMEQTLIRRVFAY